MDVRAKIVDQVLESLPELSADIRERIERTLLTSLQGYEVQERCTEVAVHDNTNMGACPQVYRYQKTGRQVRKDPAAVPAGVRKTRLLFG